MNPSGVSVVRACGGSVATIRGPSGASAWGGRACRLRPVCEGRAPRPPVAPGPSIAAPIAARSRQASSNFLPATSSSAAAMAFSRSSLIGLVRATQPLPQLPELRVEDLRPDAVELPLDVAQRLDGPVDLVGREQAFDRREPLVRPLQERRLLGSLLPLAGAGGSRRPAP